MLKWKVLAFAGMAFGLAGVGWGYAQQPAYPGFYELRIYKAQPGKRDALAARFASRTAAIYSRYGITNVVARATATAAELTHDEFVAGGKGLAAKVRRYRPRVLAVLGVTAYRAAFARPEAMVGRQPDAIDATVIWVLPNPSGLNAHWQGARLASVFRELRAFVDRDA